MTISATTRAVLRKSSLIHSGDVGFHIPPGVEVPGHVQAELELIARTYQNVVREATEAILASLLESEGIRPDPTAPSVMV